MSEIVKVHIVEDELIIAEDIKEILLELNYQVTQITSDEEETLIALQSEIPDIILLDIQLRNDNDGVNLAHKIRKQYNLPIVFITSYSDPATIERTKEIHPDGYIVKPFEKGDIFTAIEIAISNYLGASSPEKQTADLGYFFSDFVFMKRNHQFEKVRIQEIQWLKSEGNYLQIFCRNGNKYLVRSTFKLFLNNIRHNTFLQVHKSYVVNFDFVDAVRQAELVIGKNLIPIGKVYQENIRKHLNIIS